MHIKKYAYLLLGINNYNVIFTETVDAVIHNVLKLPAVRYRFAPRMNKHKQFGSTIFDVAVLLFSWINQVALTIEVFGTVVLFKVSFNCFVGHLRSTVNRKFQLKVMSQIN